MTAALVKNFGVENLILIQEAKDFDSCPEIRLKIFYNLRFFTLSAVRVSAIKNFVSCIRST